MVIIYCKYSACTFLIDIFRCHPAIKHFTMQISASVKSSFNQHTVFVETNGDSKTINISAKTTGYGSSVNGGELLLLALATCFCNDIYREAVKRKITVSEVEVICSGEFGGEGETGKNFTYKVNVVADASGEIIDEMTRYVDSIAEVHNTLRKGIDVKLKN